MPPPVNSKAIDRVKEVLIKENTNGMARPFEYPDERGDEA